jgi:hypothetical protein
MSNSGFSALSDRLIWRARLGASHSRGRFNANASCEEAC